MSPSFGRSKIPLPAELRRCIGPPAAACCSFTLAVLGDAALPLKGNRWRACGGSGPLRPGLSVAKACAGPKISADGPEAAIAPGKPRMHKDRAWLFVQQQATHTQSRCAHTEATRKRKLFLIEKRSSIWKTTTKVHPLSISCCRRFRRSFPNAQSKSTLPKIGLIVTSLDVYTRRCPGELRTY